MIHFIEIKPSSFPVFLDKNGESPLSVIEVPFSGTSYIFQDGSGLSYVVYNKEKIHHQTLALMGVVPHPHKVVHVDFLREPPEVTLNLTHWENLYHLSKFYYSVALEIFSIVLSVFRISPLKPRKLPDLDFFSIQFKDWGCPPVRPLEIKSIFPTLETAISKVEKNLPAEVRGLADLASKVCREGFSKICTTKITFGETVLSLRSVKRESMKNLVYLLYLQNPDDLKHIEEFVSKGVKARIEEVEKIFFRWCQKIERSKIK